MWITGIDNSLSAYSVTLIPLHYLRQSIKIRPNLINWQGFIINVLLSRSHLIWLENWTVIPPFLLTFWHLSFSLSFRHKFLSSRPLFSLSFHSYFYRYSSPSHWHRTLIVKSSKFEGNPSVKKNLDLPKMEIECRLSFAYSRRRTVWHRNQYITFFYATL